MTDWADWGNGLIKFMVNKTDIYSSGCLVELLVGGSIIIYHNSYHNHYNHYSLNKVTKLDKPAELLTNSHLLDFKKVRTFLYFQAIILRIYELLISLEKKNTLNAM